MKRRFLIGAITATTALVGMSGRAEAQEIQVTGPLAGAPAVHRMRLHRRHRVEIAPTASFTLLDEYQRTILLGGRLNYNITDGLAIGVWGAFGAVHSTTGLSDKIQQNFDTRFSPASDPNFNSEASRASRRLTAANVGRTFKTQLGSIQWIVSPQITAVPFRGKLALFQKIFVDTDAYFFAGPAFIGMQERADCGIGVAGNENCSQTDASGVPVSKPTATRVAIAPTFGLGLTFYTGSFMSLGVEYRALPFAWNTGGFDTHGGPPNERFPDNQVNNKDREFKFTQMITLSVGFYLPTELKLSE